uniref:HTH_48 domain-containing protein n=1 Tax=Ascaris lumbricoides TaxID=6252 RepID=A0A0M3HS44_ASCLU
MTHNRLRRKCGDKAIAQFARNLIKNDGFAAEELSSKGCKAEVEASRAIPVKQRMHGEPSEEELPVLLLASSADGVLW